MWWRLHSTTDSCTVAAGRIAFSSPSAYSPWHERRVRLLLALSTRLFLSTDRLYCRGNLKHLIRCIAGHVPIIAGVRGPTKKIRAADGYAALRFPAHGLWIYGRPSGPFIDNFSLTSFMMPFAGILVCTCPITSTPSTSKREHSVGSPTHGAQWQTNRLESLG